MSFFTRTDINVDIQKIVADFNSNKDSWPWANNKVAINNHLGIYDESDTKYKLVYTEYKHINPSFQNTIWQGLLDNLPIKKGRARIQMMEPFSLLNLHRDFEQRYHLAIVTDPACLFLNAETNKTYHVPADGYWYKVDTTRLHTAINASNNCFRTHLVVSEYV